jgi:hypothetical protein
MFDRDKMWDTFIWLALLLIPVLIGLAAMASRAGGQP